MHLTLSEGCCTATGHRLQGNTNNKLKCSTSQVMKKSERVLTLILLLKEAEQLRYKLKK